MSTDYVSNEMVALMNNGCSGELATLLLWNELDKEKISLEDCFWVWRNTIEGDQRKDEAWHLTKSKVKTFEQSEWLWRVAPENSREKYDAMELVRKKTDEILADEALATQWPNEDC